MSGNEIERADRVDVPSATRARTDSIPGEAGPDRAAPRLLTAFALLAALLFWGGLRTGQRRPRSYGPPWRTGTQLVPLTASFLPDGPPPGGDALRAWLDEHSVPWGEGDAGNGPAVYLRMSEHHWARRPLTRGELDSVLAPDTVDGADGGQARELWITVADWLDDDDGDGDPLDAAELGSARRGIQVLLLGEKAR